mgnify:CR=1 FL=1
MIKRFLWSGGLAALLALGPAASGQAEETVRLYAAGSLRAALTEVARVYGEQTGTRVATTFGPSGSLRERLQQGEAAEVFASANMEHPQRLAAQGLAGEVRRFARNQLCALAQPEVDISTDNLLERILEPAIRLGASTPKSDPAGDYAWELFRKADALRPGAFAVLDGKALKLTGAPDSAQPPDNRNVYGWVMAQKQADVFLTYCTNAALAAKEVPELQIVRLPESLAVGANYGLTVLKSGDEEAGRKFADFILSPAGQAILQKYGFAAP